MSEGASSSGGAGVASMTTVETPFDPTKLMEVAEQLKAVMDAHDTGEEVDEEAVRLAMDKAMELYIEFQNQFGGQLADAVPTEEFEALQACLSSADYDGALEVARSIVHIVAEKFGKLLAIKELIDRRITATRATVLSAVQEHATEGLKEAMDIWNTRGAVKTLTGMDPDELDADTFVAHTGPYWLLALHYINVLTLYLTPIYLAAVGTVLYFSWFPPQRDWVLLRYFIVQASLEMLSWLMVLRIEYKVRVWMSEAKRSREGGYKHHIALTLAGADEKTQLLRQHVAPGVAALEAETTVGLKALVTFDRIVASFWYSLLQLLTPLKIGWGAYGLVLYERANRCKGGSDLNELLDVFVFCFVFTLGFSFIHLIIWTFGFMLKFDAVRDYVRAKFVDFDATSGLAYPVATEFFDRVIMRNRQQTEHDARVKECARLRRERKLVESKLTSIDEQLQQFEDVDEVSQYAQNLAARVADILHESRTSHPDDIDRVLSGGVPGPSGQTYTPPDLPMDDGTTNPLHGPGGV